MITKSINTQTNAPLYIEDVNGIEIKQGQNIGKKVIPIADFVDEGGEYEAIGVYEWQFNEPTQPIEDDMIEAE